MNTQVAAGRRLLLLRLALIVALSITSVRAAESSPVFTDTDGDTYQVILTGPGTIDVQRIVGGGDVGPIDTITVSDTTVASALQVIVTQAGGGDGKVSIRAVTGSTPLRSVTAASSDLVGAGINLPGGVGNILLGDVSPNVSITSGTQKLLPQLKFTAGQIGAGVTLNAPTQTLKFSATNVGSASIEARNVSAFTILDGGFSGLLQADKKILSVSITGGDLAGTLTAPSIGPIRVLKDAAQNGGSVVNTLIAALKIGPVTVDGNVIDSKILAGAKLGTDNTLGGVGTDTDSFNAGSMGSVRIRGNVVGSIIGAGYTPFDGIFGNTDDGIFGGNRSRIGRITIGGTIDAGSRIGAGVFAAVTINGQPVKPKNDPAHFVTHRYKKGTIPPDPRQVAPPLSKSVATNLFDAVSFLFKRHGPIQPGVIPGTIKPDKVAVLRGTVHIRDATPLGGVEVSVLNHPELGQTNTREDGSFDLAVNGGSNLVLVFEKDVFSTVQRQVNPAQQDYTMVGDIAMVTLDPMVTEVSFGAAAPMAVHEASMQNDASGPRHAALIFQPGTSATLMMPDGTSDPVAALHVRATEFTVGPDGPAAMPGVLPATSMYTYCAELSADEATAAGATTVQFDKPVFFYLENFLHFPVGIDVPSGAYNKELGVWESGPSGRIIKIISTTAGMANLDVDGDGQVDTGAALTALNITDAERTQLASMYTVGQSLWRVPIPHFSGWDSNWGWGPPSDANPPSGQPPFPPDPPNDPDDPPRVFIQTQAAAERITVAGTPFTLNYRSDRVAGNKSGNRVNIPLSGATVPASLKRIELEVTIAGRTFLQTFPALANQSTLFEWDGLDAYGREVQGRQPMQIRIGNVFDGSYVQTPRFGYNGNGIPITGDKTRKEITLSVFHDLRVGSFDIRSESIGGWTLDVHHVYDPIERRLYLGDGRSLTAGSVNSIITTVVGSGMAFTQGFNNDGIAARDARLGFPFGIDLAPDGTIYFADGQLNQIFRVDPAGIIHIIAGKPLQAGSSGDGGPAKDALLNKPEGLALARDGRVIFSDWANFRIRQIGVDGIMRPFAGTGALGFSGDGGPATLAQLRQVIGVTIGRDGTVYLADGNNQRMRAVATDGIIRTIAGTGGIGFNADNIQATQALLDVPQGVTADSEGNFYIADTGNRTVRKVGPDGFITTIAGMTGQQLTDPTDPAGDGGPATGAKFAAPVSMSIDPEGSLYISDPGARRIRKFTRDGIVVAAAGTGEGSTDTTAANGDGGAAIQAVLGTASPLSGPQYTVVGPDHFLYITDGPNHRVRRVAPPLPGFTGDEFAIPSEDGKQLYRFDATGRHLATLNALTGATLFTFAYDSAGQLVKVTDAHGNATSIQRTAGGAPTAIVGPYGHRTVLASDAEGSLTMVRDPAGGTYQFTSTPGGLLLTETDPVNQVTTYTYDAVGRVTKLDDAGPSFTDLSRVDIPNGYFVQTTSALGVERTYQVQRQTNGDELRTNTEAGLTTTALRAANATNTLMLPDGTSDTTSIAADPRFALMSGVPAAHTIATGAHTRSETARRTVNLANPNNPLSVISFAEIHELGSPLETYTNTFTAATHTSVFTTPLGRMITRVFNAKSQLAQANIGNLPPVKYTYDARGRLVKVTGGTGLDTRTLNYTILPSGQPGSLTDGLGRNTTFTYDAAGRITTITAAGARNFTFGYDAAGQMTAITPPGRSAHALTYTGFGRLASYTAPDAGSGPAVTTFSYNADRQLSGIARPDGSAIAFSYDTAGRLSSRVLAQNTATLAYNGTTGLLDAINISGGESLTFSHEGFLVTGLTWTGPVAGSVTRTLNNELLTASESVNGANTIATIYDNDSLPITLGPLSIGRDSTTGFVTGLTLGSMAQSIGYNDFAELSTQSASFQGSPVFTQQFTYDHAGLVTGKTETINGVTNTFAYDYDTARRLTEVRKNSVVIETYSYDANGNRTDVGATYDAQDRLLTRGTVTYNSDAAGDLVTRTAGTQVTSYNYDAFGNLTAVTLPDSTQISYVIDGQNRRAGKMVNGTLVQGFLYRDQLSPLAELDGSNAVISRFAYIGESHVPVFMIKGGATYRLLVDVNTSVRLVVNTADGSIAQRIDYDAFGRVTNDTNPGFQPFGFAGGLYDSQTGLTRFGARDYDAETGRWTTKDPLLFRGRDTNLYAYAFNDPVRNFDPTGTFGIGGSIDAGGYVGIGPSFGGTGSIGNITTFGPNGIQRSPFTTKNNYTSPNGFGAGADINVLGGTFFVTNASSPCEFSSIKIQTQIDLGPVTITIGSGGQNGAGSIGIGAGVGGGFGAVAGPSNTTLGLPGFSGPSAGLAQGLR
jgi:RHS repeat-associated protein